jgi:DNA-binding CsgD family transcriptional regulator
MSVTDQLISVLVWTSMGYTDEEIATRLSRSKSTVQGYQLALHRILQTNNREETVRRAIDLKIINLPSFRESYDLGLLSAKQREVWDQFANGNEYHMVAANLGIGYAALESRLLGLKKKLGIGQKSRIYVAMLAMSMKAQEN